MKGRIIASALAASLVFLLGAPAFGSGDHGKEGDKPYSGHAAALGRPGDPKKAARTIEVVMDDGMRFTPTSIEVTRGETITFAVKNVGAQKHEFVLGSMEELEAHAALMRKFPEMEHDDPNAVSVEPGGTGTLVWQFTKAGRFDFACLVPGHFEAGMVGTIRVGGAAETESTERGRALTAGVVTKVDKAAGKVTIRHEPIEHLGMPKMTMVFRVKDPSMLDRLSAGDRINFVAEKVKGAFTVMQFEPAR